MKNQAQVIPIPLDEAAKIPQQAEIVTLPAKVRVRRRPSLFRPLMQRVVPALLGIGLGTLFRFWAYRQLVFANEHPGDPGDETLQGAELSALEAIV